MLRLVKLCFVAGLISATSLYAMSEQEAKQIAMESIKTVGGKLKHTLMTKAKEGGLSNAATFCSTEASNVAKEASKSLPKGVSVKRITDKPRNKMNQATPEQLKVFNEIKANMKPNEKPQMVVKKISDNHYQVYKPLKVGKKCLNCHGGDDVRNKDAYNIIGKKYPNDKAIGYKLGDFRGAFLVDIKR